MADKYHPEAKLKYNNSTVFTVLNNKHSLDRSDSIDTVQAYAVTGVCCGTGSSELECLQWKPRGWAGCCQRAAFPSCVQRLTACSSQKCCPFAFGEHKISSSRSEKQTFFFLMLFLREWRRGGLLTKDSSKICRSQVAPRVIIILFWLNLGDLNLIPIPSFLRLAQRDKIAKQVAPQLSVMSGMNFTPIYILDPSSYHYIDCLPVQIIGWHLTHFSFF